MSRAGLDRTRIWAQFDIIFWNYNIFKIWTCVRPEPIGPVQKQTSLPRSASPSYPLCSPFKMIMQRIMNRSDPSKEPKIKNRYPKKENQEKKKMNLKKFKKLTKSKSPPCLPPCFTLRETREKKTFLHGTESILFSWKGQREHEEVKVKAWSKINNNGERGRLRCL